MEIDRRAFVASLGGTAAVALMTSEEKADALEHYMEERLDDLVLTQQQGGSTPPKYPTMAELAAADAKRTSMPQRGAGNIFNASGRDGQARGPLPALSGIGRRCSSSSRSGLHRPVTCCRAQHVPSRPACRKRSFSPVCSTTPCSPC